MLKPNFEEADGLGIRSFRVIITIFVICTQNPTP